MQPGKNSHRFPKSSRILKSAEFRRVYDHGTRVAQPCFTAFCLRREEPSGVRVGFTVPRALGKAVVRNRIKRRIRESVRLGLGAFAPHWDIVFNPRRAALAAPFPELRRQMERLLERCAG